MGLSPFAIKVSWPVGRLSFEEGWGLRTWGLLPAALPFQTLWSEARACSLHPAPALSPPPLSPVHTDGVLSMAPTISRRSLNVHNLQSDGTPPVGCVWATEACGGFLSLFDLTVLFSRARDHWALWFNLLIAVVAMCFFLCSFSYCWTMPFMWAHSLGYDEDEMYYHHIALH